MRLRNRTISAEELLRAGGERLRLVRRARGLSQDDLARAVGVSRSAVAQWETGRAGCSTHVDAISSALQVLPRELLPQRGSEKIVPLDLGQATRQEAEVIRLFQEIDLNAQSWLLGIMRRLAKASPPIGQRHRADALRTSLTRTGLSRRGAVGLAEKTAKSTQKTSSPASPRRRGQIVLDLVR